MKNKIYIFLFLQIVTIQLFGQNKKKLDFYIYLIQNNYLEEANYWSAKHFSLNTIEFSQKDSFFYWKAQLFEKLHQYDSAAVYLSKITVSSSFYPKSKFNSALYYMLYEDYFSANKQLEEIKTANKQILNLKNTDLAAIYLLQSDVERFDSLYSQLDTSFYATSATIESLVFIKEDMKSRKKKSPILAATFSAIIPGSGKFYAGKTGEAFSAFFVVGALAAMFYENQAKYGFNHGRTYFAAGIFGVFYFGNILGSYYSVHREKLSFNEKIKKNILYLIRNSNHIYFD